MVINSYVVKNTTHKKMRMFTNKSLSRNKNELNMFVQQPKIINLVYKNATKILELINVV